MKRIFALFLMIFMLIPSLTACVSAPSDKTSATTDAFIKEDSTDHGTETIYFDTETTEITEIPTDTSEGTTTASDTEPKPSEKVTADNDTESTPPATRPAESTDGEEIKDPEPLQKFKLSGTVRSASGTSLNLALDWSAVKYEGEDTVKFSAKLYVEHERLSAPASSGYIMIDGRKFSFKSNAIKETVFDSYKTQVIAFHFDYKYKPGEDRIIPISAEWLYDGTYENRKFENLMFDATIPVGDKYATLPRKISKNVSVVLQNPELPEGCEVTSLAALLRHLGYNVKHTYLADNYLEQGPVGQTSYYEANLGNPRNKGKSWGCYAPVIVKTAEKYLGDVSGKHKVYDLTGYDVNEIYYQLSEGNPVIVWVTMGFEEPYVKQPWKINGKTLYWKYPLHCVILTGYDMDKNTVTVCDPMKKNPVTVDMDKFELRWTQMESQAVIIK